jgi:hypothetical protein
MATEQKTLTASHEKFRTVKTNILIKSITLR